MMGSNQLKAVVCILDQNGQDASKNRYLVSAAETLCEKIA
jgi:hypothetical protein